jgi:hypothetical protein
VRGADGAVGVHGDARADGGFRVAGRRQHQCVDGEAHSCIEGDPPPTQLPDVDGVGDGDEHRERAFGVVLAVAGRVWQLRIVKQPCSPQHFGFDFSQRGVGIADGTQSG